MIHQTTIRPGTVKATSIERICQWAFGDEKAQLEPPRENGVRVPHHLGYGSMEAALLKMAALGVRIDVSQSGTSFIAGGDTHWDAETVAAVTAGVLDRRVAEMVAGYARAGTRPSWMPGARPRLVPAEWQENQHGATPKVLPALPTQFPGGIWRPGHERRKGKSRYDGYCTPVVWEPSRQQIDSARAAYHLWWEGLHKVREHLIEGRVLKSYSLTKELPPVMPWIEGAAGIVETGPKPDWRK